MHQQPAGVDFPGTWTLIGRGVLKRCPLCGQGGLFRQWFTMVDDCPRCGLHFERVEGHWLGSLGLNTIATFGALAVVVVGGLVATYPDIAVVPLVVLSVATAVVVPLFFFPISRTMWTGIDLAMRPLEPHEIGDPTALRGGRRPSRRSANRPTET